MINSLQQKRVFLGIKDITTERQKKNGTVIWRLPIKKHGSFIEVGSFESGYVRRMNGCWTPYQLNKCEPNTEYHKEYKWCEIQKTSLKTGKYTQYIGKKRILIPGYWDRLEYLMAYCLKNYYIGLANQVEDGKFIPKWRHEFDLKRASKYTYSGGQITDNENGDIFIHEQHAYWNKIPNSVQVIVDGHRYKIK